MTWSNEELIRYRRQILLPELGEEGQDKLRSARVLVVGAGGLGCPALLYLAASGVGTIGIADGDRVELPNLHRQVLYTGMDIGKSKPDCAAAHLLQNNPYISFEVFSEYLTPENAERIISGFDLVLDCTDNFSARYLVNDSCVLLGKTWIYGSVRRFEGQVTVFNHPEKNGARSGTLRCLFPAPPAAAGGCDEEGILGVLPGMIGTVMAAEALKLVTGTGTPLAGTLLTVTAGSMNFNRWQFERTEVLWDMPSTLASLRIWNYGSPGESGESEHFISPDEFLQLLRKPDSDMLIVDVREPHELPRIHSFTVTEVPLGEIERRSGELQARRFNVVLCATGTRSRLAADLLRKSGSEASWVSLEGGLKALFDRARNGGTSLDLS